jgi:hypothetical protein
LDRPKRKRKRPQLLLNNRKPARRIRKRRLPRQRPRQKRRPRKRPIVKNANVENEKRRPNWLVLDRIILVMHPWCKVLK